ncbi:MAG: radical SAM protein [FCB group bacterium]|jgi:radical SAM superfamily enzyme YgiQ (UPF0313 family)|nr:radical SAM protein [FCB group bacterium]
MFNVALATLNANTGHMPLALLYLRSMLAADAELSELVNVAVYDLPPVSFLSNDSEAREAKALDYERIADRLLERRPRILGLSCFVWNMRHLAQVARVAKRRDPSLLVVCGGPEVTANAREVLETLPQIDIVVSGEGEVTFRELVRRYALSEGPATPRGIRGLAWRDGTGIVEETGREPIEELDSIPSPFDGLTGDEGYNEVALETMRGCPFKCGYCFYPKGASGVRFFSLERVKRDLLALLKTGVNLVYLMDPTFNVDTKRAKEILRFLAEHNTRPVCVHTELRAEYVDDEMAALLSAANVCKLEIGLQTTNVEVLDTMERWHDLERFQTGIRRLQTHENLLINVSIILGLPRDTVDGFFSTLESMLDLRPGILSIFRLRLLHGTPLRINAESLGLRYDPQSPFMVQHTDRMSAEDISYLCAVCNHIHLFRSEVAWAFLRHLKLDLPESCRLWFEWCGLDARQLLDMDTNAGETHEEFLAFLTELANRRGQPFLFESFFKDEMKKSFMARGNDHNSFVAIQGLREDHIAALRAKELAQRQPAGQPAM